jgi:hypothetical protein
MFNLMGKLRTQEALKMRCETRTSLGPPLFVNQTDVSHSRRHALTADASIAVSLASALPKTRRLARAEINKAARGD